MKKITSVLIVAGVILAMFIGAYLASGHPGMTKAVFLKSEKGDMMVVGDSPIVMRPAREGMFNDLETGDRILVCHGAVAESYPGRAKVSFVFRLGDGGEISEKLISSLSEMGWLK